MAWMEVSLDATHEAVDWVRTLLAGTTYTGAVHVAPYSPTPPETTAWAYTLRLYLPDTTQGNTLLEAIASQLSALQRTRLISELHVDSCAVLPPETAIAPITAQRVGERFVLLMPGARYQPQPWDRVLHLETSLAFGSGFHPATVLSLKLIERHAQPGLHALDLGCGSGILSVALAKMGTTVLALDNDAIATAATAHMAHQNEVAEQITVQTGSLGSGSTLGHWMGLGDLAHVPSVQPAANFDLIVANILGRVHISLAEDYRKALKPSATTTAQLITAGFNTDYENDVVTALHAAGFEVIDRDRQDEWVALAYRLQT